jgi:hypothetical protein
VARLREAMTTVVRATSVGYPAGRGTIHDRDGPRWLR